MGGVAKRLIERARCVVQGRGWALALLVWALHVALVGVALPVQDLAGPKPLAYIDSSFHQYQMQVARELWAQGRLIGYDPWFAAGHVGGVNFNVSAKLPALMAVLWPAGIAQVYKVFVALGAAVAPGLLLLGVRRLALGGGVAVVAAVLGVLCWWVTQLHWFHTAGMVSFVLASYLAFAVLAWAFDLATREADWPGCAGLGLLVALGFFLHPLFVVPVLCMALPLLACNWSAVRMRSLGRVLIAATLIGVLPNLLWLLPTLSLPGLGKESIQPFQRSTGLHIAWDEATGRIGSVARGARLNLLLWFAAAWSLAGWADARLRRLALGFVLGAVLLILFAALGGHVDVIGRLQPNRQSGAAYLMLVLPAALGIAAMVQLSLQGGRRTWAGQGALCVAALGLLFAGRELINEVGATPTPHHGRAAPEIRGEGPLTAWLKETLSTQTSTAGRILFETSLGRVHDGAHVAGPLTHALGREFIGGPYVYMHHAGFWDGYLFGQPIQSFDADVFRERLALYNIGWIVVHSEPSKAFLRRLPAARLLAERGPLAVYAWEGEPLSYVVKGAGRVESRALNRLSLTELGGDEVILKYHYVPGLQASPAVPVEPVLLPGDPQPFIRLVRPPPRVDIVYR